MTALLEEKDRPYETAKETDVTDVTDAKEMDATDAKEADVTDAKETDALTIPLVTSNNLRGLRPSAQR